MNTTEYNNEYNNADEAYDAGQVWIKKSDRFEKMEYLRETCSTDFLENRLMDEMVKWMGEPEFDMFFNHLVRNWEIKTPQELEYEMNN